MASHPLLGRLIDSLPKSFAFYHLGQVQMHEDASELFALGDLDLPASVDRLAVAYSLQGEARGALVLIFDEGLDVSTYSEMGNIIASRMATWLQDQEGLEVTISPPRILSRQQLKNVLNGGPGTARTYIHRQGLRAISLQAVVTSTIPSEGTKGHA